MNQIQFYEQLAEKLTRDEGFNVLSMLYDFRYQHDLYLPISEGRYQEAFDFIKNTFISVKDKQEEKTLTEREYVIEEIDRKHRAYHFKSFAEKAILTSQEENDSTIIKIKHLLSEITNLEKWNFVIGGQDEWFQEIRDGYSHIDDYFSDYDDTDYTDHDDADCYNWWNTPDDFGFELSDKQIFYRLCDCTVEDFLRNYGRMSSIWDASYVIEKLSSLLTKEELSDVVWPEYPRIISIIDAIEGWCEEIADKDLEIVKYLMSKRIERDNATLKDIREAESSILALEAKRLKEERKATKQAKKEALRGAQKNTFRSSLLPRQ